MKRSAGIDRVLARLGYQVPTAAGCYIIGGQLRIFMDTRPSWLHRRMMRWAFGIRWEDHP